MTGELEEAADGVNGGDEIEPFVTSVARLIPRPPFERDVREALKAVDDAVKQVFGEAAYTLPFGSLVQGAHLEGSDLDICFHLPGEDEEPQAEEADPAEDVAGDGAAAAEDGAAPHDNTRHVEALKVLMQGLVAARFRVLETRFFKKIKVPIVILAFRSTSGAEIETDISVGVEFGGVGKGFTDRVVRRVLARCPRALHLARLVKLWSKVEKLNKAYDGFLNALGWTLLVIFFCLQRGEVASDVMSEATPDEDGEDGEGSLPPPLETAAKPDQPAEELPEEVPSREDAAEFFEWVVTFAASWPEETPADGGVWALSLVDADVIEVPQPTTKFDDSATFYVEDPGARLTNGSHDNVAHSLKAAKWESTLERCQAAAAALLDDDATVADAWLGDLLKRAADEKQVKVAKAAWQRPVGMFKRPFTQMTPEPSALARQIGQVGQPLKKIKKGSSSICKWFLLGECWSGAKCKYGHEEVPEAE